MTAEDTQIVIDSSYFLQDNEQEQNQQNDFSNPQSMLEAFKDDVKDKRDIIEHFSESEKQELYDNSFKFIDSMCKNDFANAEKYLMNVLNLTPANLSENSDSQGSSIQDISFEEIESSDDKVELGGDRKQNTSEVIDTIIRKKKRYF